MPELMPLANAPTRSAKNPGGPGSGASRDTARAMSQENVEMVRGLWEPFKGVDYTAIDWDDEAIREMT